MVSERRRIEDEGEDDEYEPLEAEAVDGLAEQFCQQQGGIERQRGCGGPVDYVARHSRTSRLARSTLPGRSPFRRKRVERSWLTLLDPTARSRGTCRGLIFATGFCLVTKE